MLNRAQLIGNVGQSPEIKITPAGKELALLSVATSESWKDKVTGERKETTDWHRLVVYNQALVKIIKEYVHKGTKIYAEGKIKTRSWTDKQGVKKYTTEIVLGEFDGKIEILDHKSQTVTASWHEPEANQPANNDKINPEHDHDDDIPF
jgi:single-strand DNA-binding protein